MLVVIDNRRDRVCEADVVVEGGEAKNVEIGEDSEDWGKREIEWNEAGKTSEI